MTVSLYTFLRVITIAGVRYLFVPGRVITLAGSGVITTSAPCLIRVQARAGGGGGCNAGAGSGAGGGGGAYHAGLQLALNPGHTYTYVIGYGGNLVGAGGPSYLQDSAGPTNLLYLGGGNGGSNGASGGEGGLVYVGAGGANGGNGTGSYVSGNPNAPDGNETGGNGGVNGDLNYANIGYGATYLGAASSGLLGAGGGGSGSTPNYEGGYGGAGTMAITLVS